MSGVKNGDGSQPDEMFPGIRNPTGTGAPGSAGTRTPGAAVPLEPGAESGIPGVGTAVDMSLLVDAAGALSTEQPGQNSDGFGMVTTDQITQTGAGRGHTDAWSRKPGQQPAGG